MERCNSDQVKRYLEKYPNVIIRVFPSREIDTPIYEGCILKLVTNNFTTEANGISTTCGVCKKSIQIRNLNTDIE